MHYQSRKIDYESLQYCISQAVVADLSEVVSVKILVPPATPVMTGGGPSAGAVAGMNIGGFLVLLLLVAAIALCM